MPSNDAFVDLNALSQCAVDPHASCKARLRDEQALTNAEGATARQAWKVVDEIRASRDWWRESFWWAAGTAGVFAMVIIIAIVK